MSFKDPKPHSDEFEAFLQGEGELAALLQDIPQPEPSAKLDAAILADAERAVARSQTPLPPAANDAVVPESARVKPPSFATRWRLPLGLIVSVLITLPFFLFQRYGPDTDKAVPRIASHPPEVTIVLPESPPPSVQIKDGAELADSALAHAVPHAVLVPPAVVVGNPASAATSAISVPRSKDQERIVGWIAVIESKLAAGDNRAALEEWAAFRKIFPNAAVPATLSEKIRVLQKP